MSERQLSNRHAVKRQPLGELPNHMNPRPSAQQTNKSTKACPAPLLDLPRNESLEPNGTLAVRVSGTRSPEPNKRVSQLTVEERDSQRDSGISTSTNASNTRKRKTFIGHWQLGKTIGKGGCSRVRVVRHRYHDQYGAVKIIARTTAESTRAQSLANLIESTKGHPPVTSPSGHRPIPFGLVREIAVMKLLEHPNIVRLYDVWENHNELYLIMEYVDGGELFHYVNERNGLPEDETVYIFRQIVAALLYCHQLLICHRDLKPENILLNQQDLTVKIIDFGMAALQPEGRLLSTPCGSPHYAAPEVISSNPYDGRQADVWSCGVILYVMLTGRTPYNYDTKGDIRMLFRDITRAQYFMPPDLSLEAKDLIRRIFIPDPKRRITMDEVWEHPLLHKYDRVFGLEGPETTKEAAIGRVPKLEYWRIKRIQDIDREILRNMRTLWHSEPEQSLIQKLLNNEHNQEKLFYAALLKHREENQENYTGDPSGMGYAASDYHHNEPAVPSDGFPPLPSDRPPRSQSQYSIMNNEHLRQSHSSVRPAPSVSSYDPYRASRDPMIHSHEDHANTTVRRHGSNGTKPSGASLRHPNSLRIEMLKQQQRYSGNRSNLSLAQSGRSRHSSTLRSSTSRNSIHSSQWASSPPVIATMRPSDVHKRGVSFGHLRRTSTTSWLTTQTSLKLTSPATPGVVSRASRTKSYGNTPSPSANQKQVHSKKENDMMALETPRMRSRPAVTPGHAMRSEIRKHSAELEKACEEAFFRSSVGSNMTAQTLSTEKHTPYDTPPSSVSAGPRDKFEGSASARPLPHPPSVTPNTYLTRTLEETRSKLAAYKPHLNDNTAKFDEVMRMLENIMPASTPPTVDKRAVSAPENRTFENMHFLPVISEEGDSRNSKDKPANWQRSVTAPVRKDRKPDEHTIRMVAPSPPCTPAPLTIRKRNGGILSQPEHLTDPQPGIKATNDALQGQPSERPLRANGHEVVHIPIEVPTIRKKKSGWFGLGRKDNELRKEGEPDPRPARPGIPASWLELDDRRNRGPPQATAKTDTREKTLHKDPSGSAASSEFPMRKKRFGEGKNAFSKWLSKRGGKNNDTTVRAADATTWTNQSLNSLFSTDTQISSDAPPVATPGRSWFARFFNLKPAIKILCFQLPRGRVLQELVLLLQEWQRHGVRDLQYSHRTNIISARVVRRNTLDIKPVTFRVELFIVLEHGRKVGMTIARFVQVNGAASGFRHVLEVVDGVMRGRGWLVEDQEKWKALCEVVGG